MSNLNKIINELRNQIRPEFETPETSNLELSLDELRDRILAEEDGESLLHLFNKGEVNICKRLGLIEINDQEVKIPKWNEFISHLKIVDSI